MTSEEITDKSTEAVEGVLRETAGRQGLLLRKSRKDATYGLVDADTNAWVEADPVNGYGLSLKVVAAKLGLKVITGEDGPGLTTWAHR